jgi:transglutaminase-like putative cysteine protease
MNTSLMTPYLISSPWIDADHPAVAAKAGELRTNALDESDLVRRCFEFVRDQIRHSGDEMSGPVTCKASDVLLHGTGYCYAKSHLLAALLRANGVPAGLCYQRLTISDTGDGPCCLHGLNAVHLQAHGWYRLDPRGNKPGIRAMFTPPDEALAFQIRDPQERDLPGIWAEPWPVVVQTLTTQPTVQAVMANLPDVPDLV